MAQFHVVRWYRGKIKITTAEKSAVDFLCPFTERRLHHAKKITEAYYKINQFNIELYTDLKDLSAEQKVEAALDGASIFYNKSETWIESESLYEVLYTFEMEGENDATK